MEVRRTKLCLSGSGVQVVKIGGTLCLEESSSIRLQLRRGLSVKASGKRIENEGFNMCEDWWLNLRLIHGCVAERVNPKVVNMIENEIRSESKFG